MGRCLDVSAADDPELLDLMAAAGCRQVLIGLESLGASALEGMETRANFNPDAVPRDLALRPAARRRPAHRAGAVGPVHAVRRELPAEKNERRGATGRHTVGHREAVQRGGYGGAARALLCWPARAAGPPSGGLRFV